MVVTRRHVQHCNPNNAAHRSYVRTHNIRYERLWLELNGTHVKFVYAQTES
ncbi:hypothetical protein HMPREF9997_00842 [Corynebacterium durum F0235]|uniref:Uncharacterized protein n=1 Tax=Corynebacterium durum F0235 TaxID=1035195 RepID=L1MJW7_9CORY|nr:hypothetical protein HMPREF9997_00842 [Corynebacterium durum F0235]